MRISTRQDLIKTYIEFFKKKKHRHIPSSSLIPENDPTVLFTTAGMHPLVSYLAGQKHPLGRRLVNVQKCIRTQDIDEVGNPTHHTFFEMLGYWSLGDYFKKEAINWSFEFLTKVLALPPEKFAVSVFAGDKDIPKDKESAELWKKLKIPKKRIAFLGREYNWWGPAGETGPCGPDNEVYYWTGKGKPPLEFNVNDKRWVEFWNNVFMQYNKTREGNYKPLKQKNVDFGGGLERTLAILLNLEDNYQTPMFQPIIKEIEKISNKKYKINKRAMRIIADHIKAATFILGDDHKIKPSNLGQGYVLRRLIRRAIRYARLLGIKKTFTAKIAQAVLPIYPDYQELHRNHKTIKRELEEEEKRFSKTLEKGLKKFNQVCTDKIITGKEAFLLFQSYGFPIEMTQELANEKGVKVDLEEYNKEFKKHQDLSRTATAGIFKSGLADDSEATKKLHTATHLLNQALRVVLKDKNIKQKGSNINPERLRFDFNFSRKLTLEELKKAEDLVNKLIRKNLKVEKEELPLQQALSSGAQAEFSTNYPDMVYVYTIHDPDDKKGWFSREICTGPHVQNTKEIGNFRIIKEESVASGVRRIKAVVE